MQGNPWKYFNACGQMLKELFLNAIASHIFICRSKMIISMHPRASDEEKQNALASKAKAPPEIFQFNESALHTFPSSESLLDGVDVVVSGYSTTNLYAILKGMQGTFTTITTAVSRS